MSDNPIETAPDKTRIVPPNRNKRLAAIFGFGLMAVAGVALIISALGQNTQFFYNPSDVIAEGFVPGSDIYRMGGNVVEGSVAQMGGLKVEFEITDIERDMPKPILVKYEGVLPDLFKEGQGVVASGALNDDGVFIATELLAKHDENYQPKITYQDEKK